MPPPRKVKKLNQERQQPKREEKEHICTEEDVVKSLKEAGLGDFIDDIIGSR